MLSEQQRHPNTQTTLLVEGRLQGNVLLRSLNLGVSPELQRYLDLWEVKSFDSLKGKTVIHFSKFYILVIAYPLNKIPTFEIEAVESYDEDVRTFIALLGRDWTKETHDVFREYVSEQYGNDVQDRGGTLPQSG